ncbi:unnamed protein product [Caenorhabditis angaria]|uniref:Uncharacterized protein n=1 Tax=Caenorhabditis angaria TaxID=860376 RepID=A0A9P1IEN1_9PELO|nr:unnamed protein product [Caenorhabditis angaria]
MKFFVLFTICFVISALCDDDNSTSETVAETTVSSSSSAKSSETTSSYTSSSSSTSSSDNSTAQTTSTSTGNSDSLDKLVSYTTSQKTIFLACCGGTFVLLVALAILSGLSDTMARSRQKAKRTHA